MTTLRARLSVLIAGGGTGGHLYPGIAVARELMDRRPEARVTFAGTAGGIEARVLPREGFPLDVIRSAGLKGKSLAARLRGAALMPLSALDAWRLLSRRTPSVVVGVGGYSSGPIVALAALRRMPTLLMEQNAMPGFTNRALARLVDAAAVTYEESRAFFGSKAFVAGNPVRAEFFAPRAHGAQARGRTGGLQLLVFGGSQGAHAINAAMAAAASTLAASSAPIRITHQTGERDLLMVRESYARAGLDARVEPFLYAMADEMHAADLVICRAGATTLAELTAAGAPAILVPFPGATDDHQRKNAQAMVSGGAARMIDQRELTGDRLAAEILAIGRDAALAARMSAAARAMARPDAAGAIVDRILQLAGAA
jgi:UDP-N-acetylglucosamine--N-acetylmuramyl-(pentapeptide) pyrophosphoryl-undecaprenol N-acetylglucosamine transferase